MILLLYKITIAFFEDKVYYIMAKNDKKWSYDKMIKVIVIIAIILYTVQIYAEFSGCMDIVREIAHVIEIWHGASWKYIFYGLYYYIIMMLGMLFESLFKFIIEKLKINIESWWYKLIQMIRTTIFVLIGMLILRSHRLLSTWQMFKSIFNFKSIKTMWKEYKRINI